MAQPAVSDELTARVAERLRARNDVSRTFFPGEADRLPPRLPGDVGPLPARRTPARLQPRTLGHRRAARVGGVRPPGDRGQAGATRSRPVAGLPRLASRFLDALAEWDLPRGKKTHLAIAHLIAEALGRGLERFGESVEIDRLYRWLGIPLVDGPLYDNILSGGHLEPIKKWLGVHPEIVLKLFRYGFEESDWEHFNDFWSFDFPKRCPVDFPRGFGHLLLALADEAEDEQIARDLFNEAVRFTWSEERKGEPALEDVERYVHERPRFLSVWETARICKLDYRRESAVAPRREQKTREDQQRENILQLQKRAKMIARGEDWHALAWLALRYYGLSPERELEDLDPVNRLVFLFNSNLAQVALEGFVASLLNSDQDSPSRLGELSAQNRTSKRAIVVHAGMDLLWKGSPSEVLRLPEKTLARAVVYYVTQSLPQLGWVKAVVDRYPEACCEALLSFWMPSLTMKVEHVTGLAFLRKWPHVGQLLSLRILEMFPRARRGALESSLIAALAFGDRGRLLELAKRQLAKPKGLRTEQFVLWLGVAFLLEPEAHASKLLNHARRPIKKGSTVKRASSFRIFFEHVFESCKDIRDGFSLYAIEVMIIAFTRAYPHVMFQEGFDIDDKWDVPEWVQRLIDGIGGRADDESRDLLVRLRDHRAMTPWRDHIRGSP